MVRLEKLEASLSQLEGQMSVVSDLTVQAGTHLWRVSRFSKLLDLGHSKEEFYIHSPEFFTDSKGYKMCLLMCPNGYMNGRDTHVSMYLQLLKGPHDDDMAWPFQQTVSLQILDTSGAGRHKEYKFEPSLREPEVQCWMKPRKDHKNIGYGNHTFLAHRLLEGDSPYLKDDNLYIRVNIA